MSSAATTPTWNTRPLWGILAVLLVVGTLGAATFVFGVLGVVGGSLLSLVWATVGAAIAVLSFLFMAGILYRVDRYRGIPHRRIDLFE